MRIIKAASGKKKITLSKKEWQSAGIKAGWIRIADIIGPGFADFLGTKEWKDQFGEDITTDLVINGEPVVMSTQLSDAFEDEVVTVEHNGRHIGVYAPKEGFDFTYTKDIEAYAPYKEAIQSKAIEFLKSQRGNTLDRLNEPPEPTRSIKPIEPIEPIEPIASSKNNINKMAAYFLDSFRDRRKS